MFSAPFLLGFDAYEERIDRLSRAADGYPPYNIERTVDDDGTEHFLISIAVAGFAAPELDIVLGRQPARGPRHARRTIPDRQFLHRGIAARQFQRSFLLADGVEVKDAVLEHGMLVISVVRPKAQRLDPPHRNSFCLERGTSCKTDQNRQFSTIRCGT